MIPRSSLIPRRVSLSLFAHPTRRFTSNDALSTSESESESESKSKSNRFRILFMGRDEFSCGVFARLHRCNDVWDELVIATQPDVHVGRKGSVLSVSPLKRLGEELGVPVHTIPKVKKEFRHWDLPAPFTLQPSSTTTPSPTSTPTPTPTSPSTTTTSQYDPPATHLLITASFGRILSPRMLAHFAPSHRLNVHPSLLPAYRGPAPIQHAIIRNERETGVCVIEMLRKEEGIDAGRVWGVRRGPMPEDATFPMMRDILAREGGDLLVDVLRDMMNGTASSQPQLPAPDAPKAPFITAEDTLVDFASMSADQVYSRFRALSHQKPLFTYAPNGKPLQLNDVVPVLPTESQSQSQSQSPSPSPALPLPLPIQLPLPLPLPLTETPGLATYSKAHGMLLVRCAGKSVLGVRRVKPEGKAERAAGEFWNGVRKQAMLVVDGVKCVVLGHLGHLGGQGVKETEKEGRDGVDGRDRERVMVEKAKL